MKHVRAFFKKYIYNFIGIICLSSLSSIATAADVYFTPGLDCEDNIVRSIDNSTKTISGAMSLLRHPRIAAAIARAKKRGVAIELLFDRRLARHPASAVPALAKAGVNLRVHTTQSIEGSRFLIIDRKTAIAGSYNYTVTSSLKSSSHCIFMKDSKSVNQFTRQFAKLWKQNPATESNRILAEIMNNRPNSSNRAVANDSLSRPDLE